MSEDAGAPSLPGVWLVAALRDQARWCERFGSPLYTGLLEAAAADAASGGPIRELLAPVAASGPVPGLPLRMMAAVHRLVLGGRAPGLAAHYPSAGGEPRFPGAWSAFLEVVTENRRELRELLERPCQTNEVGRCAALVGGFLRVAAGTGLPLRLLEVGASAGLNLRWDAFFYGGAGATWGDPTSPVRLEGFWEGSPPHLAAAVQVTERRGCDPSPIDPLSEEGALALRSSVWADQPARLLRLEGGLEVARRLPAAVDGDSAETWVARRLAEERQGVASVVYQSVVDDYLSRATREAFRAALAEAGARATASRPVAWLRLEPRSVGGLLELTLTLWPGGVDERLARCEGHGTAVRWLA